jgi:hypothetical protein
MAFCLIPEKVKEFKRALKEREIDIAGLLNMTTEARTKLLERYAGENAKDVNLLFEKKLVLKNKIQGIKNWASKIGEIGRYDPARKAEIEQAMGEFEAEQMRRMLSPKEEESFLADLVETKLGTSVTRAEAKTIFDLSKKTGELSDRYQKRPDFGKELEDLSPESLRVAMEYGATKRLVENYISKLKGRDLSVKGMLKEYIQGIKDIGKESGFEATAKVIGDSVSTLTNMMINAVASWDNSWIGRQGAITLAKSPRTWWKTAVKSMDDIYKTFRGQKPEDVLMAEIYADPDYINGNYKKAKLDFGIEEEVPTKILERTPLAGKIFEASDVAFVDSAIRARRGLFKVMKKVYEAKGIKLDDTILEDMGTVINAITARGKMGRIGTSAPVKMLLWAPRMLKADWDVLTAHTFGFGLKTSPARFEAAKTIANVVIATAAVSAIAKGMGAEVETDPRSSDFLAIKVGNTRIKTPFGRGIPQIITLIARLATQSSKSPITRAITKLNSGEYGSKTLFDVGIDFLVNKTTPPARIVIDQLRGRTFEGEKPTPASMAFSTLPISVQNFLQLKDYDYAPDAVWGAFLDLFGISSSTYSFKDNWNMNPTKELQQFKDRMGQDKFDEINEEFNNRVSEEIDKLSKTDRFKNMTPDQQQEAVTGIKDDVKDQIFWDNKFFPRQSDDPMGIRQKRKEKARDIYDQLQGLTDAKAKEKIDELYRKEGKDEASAIMQYVKTFGKKKGYAPTTAPSEAQKPLYESTDVFTKIKDLEKKGNYAESSKRIKALSNEDYESFRKAETSWVTHNTNQVNYFLGHNDKEGLKGFLKSVDVDEQNRLIKNFKGRIDDKKLTERQADIINSVSSELGITGKAKQQREKIVRKKKVSLMEYIATPAEAAESRFAGKDKGKLQTWRQNFAEAQYMPPQKKTEEEVKNNQPEEMKSIIRRVAEEEGFDNPQLLINIADAESALNPRARNPKSSARGLFQILDIHGLSEEERFNPEIATRWAIQEIRKNGTRAWNSSRSKWENMPTEERAEFSATKGAETFGPTLRKYIGNTKFKHWVNQQLYGDIPFARAKEVGADKMLRDYMEKTYPLTEEAKKELGVKMAMFVSGGMAEEGAQMLGKARQGQAEVFGAPTAETAMHESLHSLIDERGNTKDEQWVSEFNSRWDKIRKKHWVMMDIDKNIRENDYDTKNPSILAGERMARMGERYGTGGLNNFPPEMRNYYRGIFKPQKNTIGKARILNKKSPQSFGEYIEKLKQRR